MKQDAYALGLAVILNDPMPHQVDVDVNDAIRVQFNDELNPKTVIGNFAVLEDEGWQYSKTADLTDRNLFTPVQGSFECKDKTIYFEPTRQLKANSRYIVYVRANGIRNVHGVALIKDFVSLFYTEQTKTLTKAYVTSPKFGLVTKTTPTLEWLDQSAPAYVLHISKVHTFETLVYDEIIQGFHGQNAPTKTTPNVLLKDGLYYARVRASNGHWSDITQFYIQLHEDGLVSQEDFDDTEYFEQYYDDIPTVFDLKSTLPKSDTIEASASYGVLAFVFDGHITLADVDLSESCLFGVPFGEEEELDNTTFIDGRWVVVYDEEEQTSHVIYVLEDDVEILHLV